MSLDKAMELKNKRLMRRIKKQKIKQKNQNVIEEKKEEDNDIFNFINNKLAVKSNLKYRKKIKVF